MSCSSPLLGKVEGVNPDTGNKIIRVLPFGTIVEGETVRIPCGHCTGCRIDKSRAWADRMMLEYQNQKKAIFATLTYRDSKLTFTEFEQVFPSGFLPCSPTHRYDDFGNIYQGTQPTIVKRDFQLFMKRLRKAFPDKKIRYYTSFEYGDKYKRPHVHSIIFGLSLEDFSDLVERGKNELGDQYWSSDRFARIWNNGFCCLTDVSWKTMAYTARYVQKKLNGELSAVYGDREPPCAVMSRNPGIASFYYDDHEDICQFAKTFVDGAEVSIPKYFLNKLSLTNKEEYDRIVTERRRFSEDKAFLELKNTSLYEDEYLKRKDFVLKNSLKRLPRNKVQ